MRVTTPVLAALSVAGMLVLGACADNRSNQPMSAAPTPTQQMSANFYRTMNAPSGQYYASSNGMTLYYYNRDNSGMSACYDDCTRQGRPYMAAADARNDGEWTVINRRDGSRQWAHRGRPVYTWHGDQREGDMNGRGDWRPVGIR